MDWNHVRSFLAVASDGSLAGAARQIGVSNATVFRHLNALESEMGSRLFERVRGRYELTEIGDQMLVLAQGIAGSFEDIERHLVGKDIEPRGEVRLTAPASFSYGFLPRHIAAFNSRYPEIHVALLVTNQEVNMTTRQADIALRVAASPPDHLIGRQLRAIRWGVYAGDAYLGRDALPTRLESLSAHRLIGASGLLRSRPAFAWLDRHHADRIGQRSDDLIAMSYLAEAGLGLAVLPDDLHRPALHRCFTFEPGGENRLWVLTHPDLRKVERVRIVMRYLTQVFSDESRLP